MPNKVSKSVFTVTNDISLILDWGTTKQAMFLSSPLVGNGWKSY